jgi:hypothetical protein
MKDVFSENERRSGTTAMLLCPAHLLQMLLAAALFESDCRACWAG